MNIEILDEFEDGSLMIKPDADGVFYSIINRCAPLGIYNKTSKTIYIKEVI